MSLCIDLSAVKSFLQYKLLAHILNSKAFEQFNLVPRWIITNKVVIMSTNYYANTLDWHIYKYIYLHTF